MAGDWRTKVDQELAVAEAAAARGNEGMARVAARRAGGWTAQAYLEAQGTAIDSPSVLDQLRKLKDTPGLSPRVYEIANHLITLKKKDHPEGAAFFPLEVDLVAEARELLDLLDNKTGG